ncbi:uncharacterized protein YER152C-like [Haliotis rufescens]|uniref:uncharacterized protein YER152C-like n=1 Tax=Haliotis rufescens TaxID=6454 RepID=UPI001EAFC6FC|nr:uncharacterized protein YER152C-like [Haliotis rufescens]
MADTMDPIAEVKMYENSSELLPLMIGGPGPDTLQDCKGMFMQATAAVLETDNDMTQTFRYADARGDREFLDQLAKFLSQEYNDTVTSSQLMLTAGATQGLHFLASLLFSKNTVAFVEDPTYYAAYRLLQHDLQMNVVPVQTDADGIDTNVLDKLLSEHRPKSFAVTPERPFWAMIYVIPVFNNPTGQCYSQERCCELVRLARQHDVLVVAEDIYNLVYYGENSPKRLLAYDKSDPAYKGNVVSNCTFSKILAPGLRLGWLEAPERVLGALDNSNVAWSGGSLNHYASKIATAIMKLGLQQKHVQTLRQIYKDRMVLMCETLQKGLPSCATFKQPQGGFFVWVQLPEAVDALLLLRMAVKKYKINFLPGFCASPSGGYKNYVRLSISFCNQATLTRGLEAFCSAIRDFIAGETQ